MQIFDFFCNLLHSSKRASVQDIAKSGKIRDTIPPNTYVCLSTIKYFVMQKFTRMKNNSADPRLLQRSSVQSYERLESLGKMGSQSRASLKSLQHHGSVVQGFKGVINWIPIM